MVSLPSCGYRRRDNGIVTEKIGCGKIERFTNLFEALNAKKGGELERDETKGVGSQ